MVENSQDNQVVVDMEASASLPSSSSARRCKYDVFLSFRGPDTRKGITIDIYDGLTRRGIKTFMDDRDLQVGYDISPTLIAAIKESRFAIVVLSQNYASSTWCLEELREICLSMEDNRILPLFYHVDPTDVRYQKKSFEDAFSKHVKSGRYTSEKVKEWRAALYKVANISGWSTTDHKTERGLVEAIVEAIVDLLSSKVVPDAIESTGDFQAFEATRHAMDEVMKALIDDKVTYVGVHGMGGVGKTTMVKHVAAQVCKNGIFNHWIMATISQNHDLIKVQDTLAELLGFTLQGKTEDGRATRLRNEIMRREKLLIIMDDVWARIELSRIGIPSYEELQKRKSKVLLTTRRLNVCHAMKCQEKISLNILSLEDSLTLFLRNARIMSFESPTFEKVVKRVAAECKGLLIALIAVARALGDKDLAEWDKAAQRLEKSQSANPDHEEDAFECMKLSYDYLKDEEYKSFFLLCCLFPEDDDIHIEELFKYAIGVGLFRDAETINEARGTAYTVVKYLKDSSLLLDSGKEGCVRMHDVVRDTALNIANSEGGHRFLVKAGCGLDDWPSRLDEGCTAISLMRNRIRKLPPQLVCPKLQILSLSHNFDLDEIPETFFQTLNELRVLDLSETAISYLPQSFGLLTNLRALYLDGCGNLKDISVVGKIMTLEVLSMKGSDLEELPREIGNLTNLRVLDITGGDIYKIPSKLLSKLHSLEELYLHCQFREWGSKVDGEGDETNSAFDEGMDEIEYVFGYEAALLETEQSKLRKIELSRLTRVRSLCEGPAPPAMFQNLQHLSIKWCNLEGSLFTYDVAQCLSQLNFLDLLQCPLLERIVEASNKKIILPKLKHLRLSHLPVLYYESATFDIECPSLEEVGVKDCPKFSVSVSDFHSRNQVQLHEDPFVDWYRSEKQLLGDIVESVSTHTVGSEEFQETRQGMDELMEVHTDDEVSAIEVYGAGGVGKTTMVIPSGSSSSSAVNWKYDVYLSFRGGDTRKGFTSTLCDGLKKRGITTFMDADLQEGDPISITLIKAIEESRFVIVVLSPNYATSIRCLEELTKICKFMEDDLRILPVFYAVKSRDVRYQKGSFEDAFTTHERSGRYGLEKVQQWREALRKVGSLSGWLAQDYKTEIELIEAIVEFVCSKIYTAGFEVFEATRRAMDEVMKALKDEEVAAIGVYGVGGVGKTTMVEHVCAKVWYEGMFHHVINVVVSKSPDLRKMQGTLADVLGLELEEETDIGRSHRLMQKIRRGSRILIILDDIREDIDLSSIGIPGCHELQRSNSKVLLITRTQNVLCAMECRSNICLDVLSEKDSLTLFMNRARMSFESINFYYAAKKVASVCAGLPIALIAVAKALGGKDNWEEAAQRLKASRHANPEDEDIVFNCIKLSYDYLAYDDARSCFLLCCLFPEDYDIQIEDLLKYGMGKGLFQDSSTMQDARASAHSVVKYLRDCGLLLESGRDGCVKMHDVIRDVAIRISSFEDGQFFVRAGCQLTEWPSISAPEGYFAISLIRNKICKLPEELVCSKLLILFMQSNVCLDEIPEDFFRGLNKLRVLDLSRTRISLLPMSFNLLINLHTLYLDGCLSIIDNISVLQELKGLKILSMRDLPLVELPKEIGHLKNLRMLDVTGEYVDIVPSEVIRSLDRLEELYMQCNFADWGSKVGRNEAYGSKVEGAGEQNMAAFDELTSLSNLNILKVFISDAKSLPTDVAGELNWVNFDICISRNSSIRKVSLASNYSPLCTRALTVGTTINTLPVWFVNVVTSKTEKLQYIMCWGLDNILVEYDCGRLHALKYLSVIGPSENLKVLMDTVTFVQNEPVFQKLEELHLVQVDCLKELCVGELPQGSLCNLRFLKVKHCYELAGALLPSQLLQRLQNLEKLICEEIDELEYVFGCEGLKLEHVILTQLKEMRLENLGKLIKIWNGPAPCTIFQNLHSLVVSGCFELKTLFTADVAQSLLQLEDLLVECCLSLDRVIEASKETMDSKIVIPRLKNLALIKLPQLTRFYGNTGSAIECPQLKNLYEEKCPLFSASDFHRVQLINHQQHLDIVHKRPVLFKN